MTTRPDPNEIIAFTMTRKQAAHLSIIMGLGHFMMDNAETAVDCMGPRAAMVLRVSFNVLNEKVGPVDSLTTEEIEAAIERSERLKKLSSRFAYEAAKLYAPEGNIAHLEAIMKHNDTQVPLEKEI